eukprot:CAMPEP_0179009204 /NCGR_PEP_ID=MMETSP0795-20121207/16148_1 /TAXON_ID=88552 /ORGANISM="Amoebophrya sp., Strain Ameob2" /LENGTH=761 /DNA_ID=CAMNT_0020704387 /DNA_START=86 /DNA_END=2373 /DNA_ORIENTATION=+
MLTGEATFKLPFTGVNLDRAQVEKLPQPYRFLSKIVDQLFEDVSDKILEIEKRKREQVFEYNLPEIQSTGRIEVSAGASGSSSSSSTSSYCYQNGLVACGSDSGELLLLDLVRTGKLVCSMQVGTVLGSSPEPVGEEGGEVEGGVSIVAGSGGTGRKEGAVTHVAMTTGFYRRRALCENCTLWRKTSPKIVCAVTGTSDLRVCEFRKPTSDLAPFAKIALSAGNNLTEVLSLHSWAASGALWTCVFVTAPPAAAPAGEQEAAPPAPSEAKILVFRSNLGVPVSSAQERKPFTIEETAETDTEQHGAGGAGTNAAWDSLPESSTVSTPIYVFDQLPGFSVRAVRGGRQQRVWPARERASVERGRATGVLRLGAAARGSRERARRTGGRGSERGPNGGPVAAGGGERGAGGEQRGTLFWPALAVHGQGVGRGQVRQRNGAGRGHAGRGGDDVVWVDGHSVASGVSGALRGGEEHFVRGERSMLHRGRRRVGAHSLVRKRAARFPHKHVSVFRADVWAVQPAVRLHTAGRRRLGHGAAPTVGHEAQQKLGKLVAMEGSFAENTKLFAAYDSFGVFQTQDEHTIISVYDTNVVLQDLFKGISSRLASGNGRLSAGKLFRVLTTEQRMRAPPIAKPPRDQCAPSQSQKSGAGSQRGVQRQPSGTTKSIPGSGASASGGAGRSSKKSPSKRGSSKNALTQATLAAHEVQYDLPAGATRQYDAEPNPQDEKWRKTAIERYRQTLAEKSSARKKINALLEEVTKKIGGS